MGTDGQGAAHVLPDEGTRLWVVDELVPFKATGRDTTGAYALTASVVPPQGGPPPHVHHREDEAFWVLAGSATFEVGGETVEATAGDFLFGPRDIPHRYETGPDGCRLLFILTPGGFEGLVREMGVPAERRTLPPDMEQEPDGARIAEIGRRYGCEVLG